jgi:ABC-type transport system involved in multi-copper enzyme maturation permease subunit
MGAWMATGGSVEDLMTGDTSSIPDWFWFELFLSPQDGSGAAAMLAFGTTEFFGFDLDMPPWISLGTIALAQIIWTIVPLTLAAIFFQKRDV